MKTRAKPKAADGAVVPSPAPKELPAKDINPSRLLILNKNISKDARIMTLLHPRTQTPTRYFVCPTSGIYELRRVTSSAQSSWLLHTTKPENSHVQQDENDAEATAPAAQGYVSKTSDVFLATPLDPLFVLLPGLERQSIYHGERRNRQLLSMDDLFEDVLEKSNHFSNLMASPLAGILETRLAKICQMVEVDDTKMYRLDDERLFTEILSKAKKMCASGLPPTMEDKFVTRALEKPVSAAVLAAAAAAEDLQASQNAALATSVNDIADSQSTSAAASTVDSQKSIDTNTTTPDADNTSVTTTANIEHLQRLRTSFTFIVSSYFSPTWEQHLLKTLLSPDSGIDFAPLDEHLKEIALMKEEALLSRSIGDFSRKRGMEDDEFADRAEKRKKLEEDEKRRKANESRGVRDLKKVNVSGMKKMSDFFKKVPVK